MGRVNVLGGGRINPPLATTVNQVIEGCEFSINGKDILVGTMVNRGVLGVTPSDAEQIFLGGYYPSITIAARPALTGDAATANVLAGKTFYNSSYTRQNGAMVDRGALNLTPTDSIQTGLDGYYSGITVAARPVLSGDAAVANVLATKTFYNSSYTKQTGTMVNRAGYTAATATDGVSTVGRIYARPAVGFYDGVDDFVTIDDADFVAANFLATKNVYGLQGTIPVRTNTDTGGTYPSANGQSFYDGMAYLQPSAGYYDGNVWCKSSVPNLTAANVRSGTVIGSITGTLVPGKAFATGEGEIAIGSDLIVTGLAFTPAYVIIRTSYTDYNYQQHVLVPSYNPRPDAYYNRYMDNISTLINNSGNMNASMVTTPNCVVGSGTFRVTLAFVKSYVKWWAFGA